MNYVAIAKGVIGLTAGIGSSVVVNNVAKATLPIGASKFNRIATLIGSFAIGGVVSAAVEKHSDEEFEKLARIGRKIKNKTK